MVLYCSLWCSACIRVTTRPHWRPALPGVVRVRNSAHLACRGGCYYLLALHPLLLIQTLHDKRWHSRLDIKQAESAWSWAHRSLTNESRRNTARSTPWLATLIQLTSTSGCLHDLSFHALFCFLPHLSYCTVSSDLHFLLKI